MPDINIFKQLNLGKCKECNQGLVFIVETETTVFYGGTGNKTKEKEKTSCYYWCPNCKTIMSNL